MLNWRRRTASSPRNLPALHQPRWLVAGWLVAGGGANYFGFRAGSFSTTPAGRSSGPRRRADREATRRPRGAAAAARTGLAGSGGAAGAERTWRTARTGGCCCFWTGGRAARLRLGEGTSLHLPYPPHPPHPLHQRAPVSTRRTLNGRCCVPCRCRPALRGRAIANHEAVLASLVEVRAAAALPPLFQSKNSCSALSLWSFATARQSAVPSDTNPAPTGSSCPRHPAHGIWYPARYMYGIWCPIWCTLQSCRVSAAAAAETLQTLRTPEHPTASCEIADCLDISLPCIDVLPAIAFNSGCCNVAGAMETAVRTWRRRIIRGGQLPPRSARGSPLAVALMLPRARSLPQAAPANVSVCNLVAGGPGGWAWLPPHLPDKQRDAMQVE